MYTKFHCAALRIKKALGIFRELITTRGRRTTRVAFWDLPSGSKNDFTMLQILFPFLLFLGKNCLFIAVTFVEDTLLLGSFDFVKTLYLF